MTGKRRVLAAFYFALSAAGLVGTWTWNLISIAENRNFVGDWVSSGPAVASLSLDILIAAIAASIFMIVEGRRLRMRFLWAYVALIPIAAFAFSFPLFLAMRERTLSTLSNTTEKDATS